MNPNIQKLIFFFECSLHQPEPSASGQSSKLTTRALSHWPKAWKGPDCQALPWLLQCQWYKIYLKWEPQVFLGFYLKPVLNQWRAHFAQKKTLNKQSWGWGLELTHHSGTFLNLGIFNRPKKNSNSHRLFWDFRADKSYYKTFTTHWSGCSLTLNCRVQVRVQVQVPAGYPAITSEGYSRRQSKFWLQNL